MTASDPASRATAEALGIEVHAAWRDGMLRQGRAVAPERMTWETLSEQDRELDRELGARLALRLLAQQPAAPAEALGEERDRLRAALEGVERLLTGLQPHIPQACLPKRAAFIDNYVSPALDLSRPALTLHGMPEQVEESYSARQEHAMQRDEATRGMLASQNRAEG